MRLIALLALLLAGPCFAQGSVTLTCTPPTTYVNGTPITGAITYKFFHGTTQGQYSDVSPVQSACNYVWPSLPAGTHWFAATAIVNGLESVFSAPTSKGVTSPPNPPTNLTASQDLTAYVLVKSRDRVVMVPAGTVAPGTACDSTQEVLGRYVVPRSAVTFVAGASDEVVFAACS